MKKGKIIYMCFCFLTGGMSILLFAAVLGAFTEKPGNEGRNELGGIGEVRAFAHDRTGIMPPFRDDDTIYYVGEPRNLYAYHVKTGKQREVCTRLFCQHDTTDCCLYPLYDSGFMDYFILDGFLYYTERASSKIVLYRWDISTGKKERVCEFFGSEILTDEYGTQVEIPRAVYYLERINTDTILVQCGREVFLFDNRFELKKNFLCAIETYFAWSEDVLVWLEGQDLCAYRISTGEFTHNLAQKAYEKKTGLSSECFYCLQDRVYCTVGEKFVTFGIGEEGVDELAVVSLPARVSLIDGVFYYVRDGKVFCMVQGIWEEVLLPEMEALPYGVMEERLVTLNFYETGLYTLDGKKVNGWDLN